MFTRLLFTLRKYTFGKCVRMEEFYGMEDGGSVWNEILSIDYGLSLVGDYKNTNGDAAAYLVGCG